MSDFDVRGARKAGYSDAEIADYLAASKGFDAAAARQAGYKDSEIVDHLQPPPSAGRRALDAVGGAASAAGDAVATAGNYRDTRFAKAMGGVAGLPRMFGEAVKWAGEKTGINPAIIPFVGPAATGALQLPTGEQASQFMLDRAKARPDFEETNLNPVVDAGVESLFAGPLVGAAGKMGPVVNATAAMGGEAAGHIPGVKGTALEPYARVAGSLVGGLTPFAADKIVRSGASLVSPFTKGGRDKIVGSALTKSAADPQAAIANMDSYTPPVPGFQLPAGKASRDPGMMAVQEVIEPKAPGMRATYNTNNETLTKALDALDPGADPKAFVAELAKQDAGAAARAKAALDALPPGADAATAGKAIQDALRGRYEGLDAARARATRPLYDQARSFPDDIRIGPLWQHVDDVISTTKGDVQAAAIKARDLLVNAKGEPDWSAAGMMNARDALGDMIGGAPPGSRQQAVLMGIRDRIDDSLSAVPAEQQARQTYAEMSRPLDTFKSDKGARFVEGVVEKDRFGQNFMLPAERVPSQFFRSGDAGAATMKEFLAANDGNQSAIDAMRTFVSGKARDAKDIKAFLQQNRPAIEALDPALARQLEEAATTKGMSAGFRASPAGRFVEGDLDAAVRSTLGAPDSTKRMQSLRMSVGSNDQAVAGLRKAVLDDFRRSALSNVAEDAAGNARMTANGAERWLQANRGAITNVLTPEQISGLDAISRALKDQALSIPGRTGSPTFDRLASESILGAFLTPGMADAPILHPITKALGIVYGGSNEAAMQRLVEVMQDPKVAAALMKKATASNVKMAEPVLKQLAGGAAVSQSVGSRE